MRVGASLDRRDHRREFKFITRSHAEPVFTCGFASVCCRHVFGESKDKPAARLKHGYRSTRGGCPMVADLAGQWGESTGWPENVMNNPCRSKQAKVVQPSEF